MSSAPEQLLYYRLDGDRSAPVLVLSGSLGSTLELWEPQLPAFEGRFCVLRYDHPGHGRSPLLAATDMVGMAARVIAVLDVLSIRRASFCGLSLGGMLGMQLALHAPDRLERLVLCCTSPRLGTPADWQQRAALVRARGVEAVADGVMGRWFTPSAAPATVERAREMLLSTPREAYARCCESIRDFDVRDELARIGTPTLVVAAEHDPTAPPAEAKEWGPAISGSELSVVPGAAHLANAEQPQEFTRAVLAHLTGR